MWEPFETEFDAINVRFDDRVRIVIRTAGVVEHTRLRSKELLKAQQKDGDTHKGPLGKTLSDLGISQRTAKSAGVAIWASGATELRQGPR